jgi:hypothetical protein
MYILYIMLENNKILTAFIHIYFVSNIGRSRSPSPATRRQRAESPTPATNPDKGKKTTVSELNKDKQSLRIHVSAVMGEFYR